jgi:hypothetical protein
MLQHGLKSFSFQLSAADTMLSTSEHKVSQPSFSQNRSSNSTGLDMDKTEVGLSYSAPNTAAYQTSDQSHKASGTGYQQASSYTSSNYSSTQVSLNRTQQYALLLILIFTVPCQAEIHSQNCMSLWVPVHWIPHLLLVYVVWISACICLVAVQVKLYGAVKHHT